jgi:DNA-binding NarL/FixJ family response regulator
MPLAARVLIVDDHEGWRRGVSSVLRSHRWRVVGEAGDGVEAVDQASALCPDVILLDIELPKMTGLEAAARILAAEPTSRILFVSGHRTWDIVEAAFAAGGRGYLLKGDVGHELLPAMSAILAGERFISRTLTGRSSERSGRHGHRSRRHEVGFYSEDSLVVDEFVRVGKTALDAGKTFILAAQEPRQREVRYTLEAFGVNVERAIAERRYLAFAIADVLSAFMIDDRLDEEQFWKTSISLLARAAGAARCEPPGVAVCGEGCAFLLRSGKPELAIRIEHLWDELARMFNVEVSCPYLTAGIEYEPTGDVFRRVSAEHSAVLSR